MARPCSSKHAIRDRSRDQTAVKDVAQRAANSWCDC
jgi:hypothetical protein